MSITNVRHRVTQGEFKALSRAEQQQEAKSRLESKHPERPYIADMPAARRKGREGMLPVNVRATLPKDRRFPDAWSHTVHEGDAAKIIGYNAEEYPVEGSDKTQGFAATTGTSRPNVLCVTDGMGPCIGVAIIGEKDGQAKVRVFHVFNYNDTAPDAIKAHIDGLKKDGMAVRIGISGGIKDDKDSEDMLGRIETSISETDRDHSENPVSFEFNTGCTAKKSEDIPLGVIIDDNHKGRFVQEIVMAPAPGNTPQPRSEWTYPVSTPSVLSPARIAEREARLTDVHQAVLQGVHGPLQEALAEEVGNMVALKFGTSKGNEDAVFNEVVPAAIEKLRADRGTLEGHYAKVWKRAIRDGLAPRLDGEQKAELGRLLEGDPPRSAVDAWIGRTLSIDAGNLIDSVLKLSTDNIVLQLTADEMKAYYRRFTGNFNSSFVLPPGTARNGG